MKAILIAVLLLAACASGPQPGQSSTGFSRVDQCTNNASLSESQRQLIGTWRHVELIRVLDGHELAPQSIPGENIAHFYCDGTWDAIGPNFRSAGTFKWLSDHEIEQKVIESNLAIQIGLISNKRVIVSDQKLEFQIEQTAEQRAQVMPPPSAGAKHVRMATLVITRFKRVGN